MRIQKLLIPFLLVSLTALPLRAESVDIKEMSMPKMFGYFLALNQGLEDLGFSDEEKSDLLEGMTLAIREGAIHSEEDLQVMMPQLQAYLQDRVAAQQATMAAAGQEAEAAYFAELDGKEGVTKDDSGFYYEILEEGDGAFPTMDQEVEVNYEGRLIDGTVFDSSYQRGQAAVFPLTGVIPGFGGGLTKVKEGGKIRIHIPAELGYGNNPPQGSTIRPGSTLVFEVELLDIVEAEAEAPMPE